MLEVREDLLFIFSVTNRSGRKMREKRDEHRADLFCVTETSVLSFFFFFFFNVAQ